MASTQTPLSAKPLSPMAATPLWLPASYFTAGLLFYVIAALLLPFVATDLSAGRFLAPRVVAVVHLITLGWLTMSIMGALCQLFPVTLSTPLRWQKLALVTLALYAPGLALFVCGLWGAHSLLIVIGAIAFGTGLLLFIANAVGTLVRAKNRDLTWWALALAFFFLLATIAFGGSLAGNYRWNYLADRRLAALTVHMHVALGGWVLLVVMAVGRRLLPMFLLSHKAEEKPLRAGIALMTLGALLLSFFHPAMTPQMFALATSIMGIAVLSFLAQLATYVRARHRPQLDAGLRMVVAAGVLLVVAVLLGFTLLYAHPSYSVASAYGIAIVGALALFVAGHYYKIVPFLVWNHRYAPLVGKRPLPKINELFSPRIANFAAAASVIGMYGLVASALVRSSPLALVGGVLFAVGVVTELSQLGPVLHRKVV